ncbi:MAG: hypothetical protein AAGJ28_25305, partial [Pseudomonadota bacterium]
PAVRRRQERYVTGDSQFTTGFLEVIPEQDIGDRIETYVFARESNDARFRHLGRVIQVEGRTREARRFSMIHAVDGLIAVSGTGGTDQQITFALATQTPVLPVPCFGNRAAQHWDNNEDDLAAQMGLTRQDCKRWKTPPKTEEEAKALAEEMLDRFLASLSKRCFVIMPFAEDFDALNHGVIDPAVQSFGDEPIHLGNRGEPGDVGEQIREGIDKADYIICVLDGLRPNVLFELGMAQAKGKPTILLWSEKRQEAESVPFDIAHEQRINYGAVDDALLSQLQKAIGHVR